MSIMNIQILFDIVKYCKVSPNNVWYCKISTNCQAQPKSQLSWAEIAIKSNTDQPATHPPGEVYCRRNVGIICILTWFATCSVCLSTSQPTPPPSNHSSLKFQKKKNQNKSLCVTFNIHYQMIALYYSLSISCYLLLAIWILYMNLAITCKNLFLSLVFVRPVIFWWVLTLTPTPQLMLNRKRYQLF